MMDNGRLTSLRTRIFTRTLFVSLIPLALLAAVAFFGLRNLERTADDGVRSTREVLAGSTVTARLHSEAETAGREIDLVLAERINDVVTWSRQPAVIAGSEIASDVAAATGLMGLDADAAEASFEAAPSLGAAPLADAFLAAELERRPEFVDISYTDRNGFNAGVVGIAQDFVQSDEAWWQSTWENGIFVGGVTFHPESGRYVIPIASRVENDEGTRIGVLRASLGISFVQAIAEVRRADQLEMTVVTAGRQLLAETSTDHDPERIGSTELSDDEFSDGDLQAFETGIGALVTNDAVYGFTRIESTRGTAARDDAVDQFDWFVIVSQPADIAFAPLAGLVELDEDLGRAGQQLAAVAVIGLIVSCLASAMAASILSRRIVNPINALAERVQRVADTELPATVARAHEGDGDIEQFEEPEPIDVNAGREMDKLASSFNSVQKTAIRLAAEQAQQRRTTAEMFANLGRRNQSLVKRQLRFIEELEKSEEDPDRLASLFRLDHLATRMRRNAESLLVIAGHRGNSRRSAPVRVELVAQVALGEVENFDRTDISGLAPAALTGRAVADVAHVLAELIENALAFSPPEAPVVVTGEHAVDHYRISVVDRGIGLSTEELADINERLAADAGVEVTSSKQLGLLVVSKLAARHGLRVRLAQAPEGIAAIVDIPDSLVQPADAASTPRKSGEGKRSGRPAPAAAEVPPDAGGTRVQKGSPPATTADPPMRPSLRTGDRADGTTDPATEPAALEPAAEPATPSDATAPEPEPEPASPLTETTPEPEPQPASPLADTAAELATEPEPEPASPLADTAAELDTAPWPEPAPASPLADTAPWPEPEPASPLAETAEPQSTQATIAPPRVVGPATDSEGRYLGSLSPTAAAQVTSVPRRTGRRKTDQAERPATTREKRAVATTDSTDEVVEEAEKLRNRWSSFQQGRRSAGTPVEPGPDAVTGEHE